LWWAARCATCCWASSPRTDIATDARPEQIKPLFRRAIIIGRRFRLVHVMMGQDTVEVSTFRAATPDVPNEKESHQQDEHGRVLRDNVFGTMEEDARRRDFTVNALYYDPATEEVVDFHGGLADLKKRAARDRRSGTRIGTPCCCARSDWEPSWLIRTPPPASDPRDGRSWPQPPARLFDEMLQPLLSGARQRPPAAAARGRPEQGPVAAAARILERPSASASSRWPRADR
jgi:hypothetical protein